MKTNITKQPSKKNAPLGWPPLAAAASSMSLLISLGRVNLKKKWWKSLLKNKEIFCFFESIFFSSFCIRQKQQVVV